MSKQPKNLAKTNNGPSQDLDEELRVISWNAGGLTNSKFLELKHTILRSDADLFYIYEAGLATEVQEFYKFNGYTIYILPRARQVASGIVAGVKNEVVAKFSIAHAMEDDDLLEAVTTRIWKGKKQFVIHGLYNPPNNQPGISNLFNDIQPNCILIGDFNAPSKRWGYTRTSPVGRCIEDFVDDNLLTVMDTPPTFLSFAGCLSRPDLCLAHSNIHGNSQIKLLDDAAGCGHRALLLTVKLKQKPYSNTRAPRWNFQKGNWKRYKTVTDQLITTDLLKENNPEETVKLFNQTILRCATECVPRGQVKGFKPYWNKALTSLKQARNTARRSAERSGNLIDCTTLRRKQSQLSREIKLQKKTAYKTFVKKLDFRKDGVKAHKFITTLENKGTPRQTHPLLYGTRTLTDKRDMANAFCSYYAKVSRISADKTVKRHLNKHPPPNCLNEKQDKVFNKPFTLAELEMALSTLKCKKSAGPDGIYTEFLINLGEEAKKTLLKIINLTWTTHVPDQWRKSEIIPLLKKGKPAEQVSSYRPIALTSITSKLAERLVLQRLKEFLDDNHTISDAQAGFRPRMNTVDQIMKFTQNVKDGFNSHQSTLAVLVDFQCAYDKVWRKMLLHKLINCGLSGNLLRWIRSFLSQRHIRVRFSGSTSRFRIQREGLPQGAVLSCMLFNVMINDIIAAIGAVPGVNALLYADDLLLWATGSGLIGLQEVLNAALLKLHQWATKNSMTVSGSKTVFQLFTLSTKKTIKPSLEYNGTQLREEHLSTYLGVQLDKKLTWKQHVEDAAQKGSRRSRILKRLTATKWGASQDVLSLVYKTYVRPVMEYGSEVVGTASNSILSKLDKVQNAALRTITGAVKTTPIAAMELQSGIEPLEYRRDKNCLKFWERNKRAHSRYWSNYRPACKRLKTQKSPLAHAESLIKKYNISLGEPAEQLRIPQIYPNLPKPNFNLLDHHRTKTDSLGVELRKSFYQTIHSLYPYRHWLHVYTDGSSIPQTGNTGAGFYCHLFEGAIAVGTPSSNFEGEVAAVNAACNKLSSVANFKNIVFLVDSQSAIAALSGNSPTDSSLTLETRMTLNKFLQDGWNIKLQWVPSHVDIMGNERADFLAKRGTTLWQPQLKMPLSAAKALIDASVKQTMMAAYHEIANGKSWERLAKPGPIRHEDRFVAVPSFRILTGHDLLPAHLHRFGTMSSAECPLCSYVHFDACHLRTCPALEEERKKGAHLKPEERIAILYWSARHRMAEMPRVGVG